MYIRNAKSDEAEMLSELALRSKVYWGYDEVFIEQCRLELTIDPQDCEDGWIKVAVDDDRVVGLCGLSGELPDGELTDLFVDPDYIGRGLGAELYKHAVTQAKVIGYSALLIHADPHAEQFYLHMGAKRIGSVPSGSIEGRVLPLMSVDLGDY